MIQVTYFHRKPRVCSYSVEFVFEQLREDLAGRVLSRVHVAPFFSNGLFRRVGIVLDTAIHAGQINHITGDITFAGLLLPKARTILTILDCGGADAPGIKGHLLRWLWFRLPAKRAAIITTISNAAREDILRITKCRPEKVVVIPVAISKMYRQHPKLNSSDPPRILQVGTSANKNLERVVEALEGIQCTLVIIGELTDNQRKLLQHYNVSFSNFVGLSRERLYEEYQLCDLVTFVSLFEGFGMPIVEAQSVGRPVLTSSLCSLPEVAGDGAYFIEDPTNVKSIRNGILQLLRDPVLRNRLVNSGLINAKRFNSQSIAHQYFDIYQRVSEQITNSNHD